MPEPQERRSALLKKRAEARARGESEESSVGMRAKEKAGAAGAAATAAGTRFSIDEEEAAQVFSLPRAIYLDREGLRTVSM